LIFTAAATLGSGEHYFVDLVVAFPSPVLIEPLCSFNLPWPDWRKILALAWGLGATLTWLALLRFGPPLFWISPIVPWSLIVATILLSRIHERGLQAANRLIAVPEAGLGVGGGGGSDSPATDTGPYGQVYERRSVKPVQGSPRQDDAEAIRR
jgi:hypothetical protein